ncbi:MAG TPA: CPBP family intramembrane glutamic endopeptidase [Thermoanaerobaculia bacterium]|nr:CPBP family intramembrane glutamic endopeptidase [Thermoanaerobaculia bacterium]
MRLRWPPPPLGFGTPLNLALGRRWKPSLGMAVAVGLLLPPVILLIDRLLFQGVSMERVRAFVAQPLATRIAIVSYAGIVEELVFRVVISTLVAWLSYLVLKRATPAIWIGIAVAAVFFGLAHVANLANVPHPYLRAITLNGIAGVALGWLYWRRGLEWAVLAHLIADATMYLVLPAILLP